MPALALGRKVNWDISGKSNAQIAYFNDGMKPEIAFIAFSLVNTSIFIVFRAFKVQKH